LTVYGTEDEIWRLNKVGQVGGWPAVGSIYEGIGDRSHPEPVYGDDTGAE
jgi:hypothetical protein